MRCGRMEIPTETLSLIRDCRHSRADACKSPEECDAAEPEAIATNGRTYVIRPVLMFWCDADDWPELCRLEVPDGHCDRHQPAPNEDADRR